MLRKKYDSQKSSFISAYFLKNKYVLNNPINYHKALNAKHQIIS